MGAFVEIIEAQAGRGASVEVFVTMVLPGEFSIVATACLSSAAGSASDAYCHSATNFSGTYWDFGNQPAAVADGAAFVVFGLRAAEGYAKAALTVLTL